MARWPVSTSQHVDGRHLQKGSGLAAYAGDTERTRWTRCSVSEYVGESW